MYLSLYLILLLLFLLMVAAWLVDSLFLPTWIFYIYPPQSQSLSHWERFVCVCVLACLVCVVCVCALCVSAWESVYCPSLRSIARRHTTTRIFVKHTQCCCLLLVDDIDVNIQTLEIFCEEKSNTLKRKIHLRDLHCQTSSNCSKNIKNNKKQNNNLFFFLFIQSKKGDDVCNKRSIFEMASFTSR